MFCCFLGVFVVSGGFWLWWVSWLLWLLWRLAFVAFVASGCLLVHLWRNVKSEAQLPDVRRSCFHPDDSFGGFLLLWLLMTLAFGGFLPFRGFGWLLSAFRVFIH